MCCLFDLDGVLTQTAKVHSAAWKEMFDAYLKERAERDDTEFVPFSIESDYPQYVDGMLRQDGVRRFLASRTISLPEGSPDDDPSQETVFGLGNRKNERVVELIREKGVDVYDGSVRFLDRVVMAGMARCVVSASKNTPEVLKVTGLDAELPSRVDGTVAAEHQLPGKPAPDTYLFAAKMMGFTPAQCVVIEDAISGVQAGVAGEFGYVVGVDRVGQRAKLEAAGASIVVDDLAELLRDA